MRIINGRVGGGVSESGGWDLYKGEGVRRKKIPVVFKDESFREPPDVIVSICSFDLIQGRNHRLNVYAEKITAQGFTVVIETWADTSVFSARATWIAIENYGWNQEPKQ